jgi:hypothetical protein
MSRHLIVFAAAVALAGCSGGVTSEAQLASAQQPVERDYTVGLDDAPPVIVPEAFVAAPAPLIVEKPQATPEQYALPVRETLWCDISVKRTVNGMRITPLVRADQAMSGEYSLVITRKGGAGSSDISQGGPFDARRGVRHELGSSEFSLERGSSFRAVLRVRADGREVCREVRS